MSMEDRNTAFENKYKHDEEVKFKVDARLAKLFGLWVAGKLGLDNEKAALYAKEMVATQLDEAGNEDIIRKATADFSAAGIDISRTIIDTELAQMEHKAREQIMSEEKKS